MRGLCLCVIACGCSFQRADAVAELDAPVTPGTPMIDAAPPPPPPPIDAVEFAPELCPATYDRTIAGHPGSRYRFIRTLEPFATHHAACNADRPGWTHLIVVDDMAEAMAAGQIEPQDYAWVGAVQGAAGAPNAGWHLFTGGAPTTGWSPVGQQPDDGGADHVENGEESLAVVASTGNMHDASGLNPHAAACECDGLAIDPAVGALIP